MNTLDTKLKEIYPDFNPIYQIKIPAKVFSTLRRDLKLLEKTPNVSKDIYIYTLFLSYLYAGYIARNKYQTSDTIWTKLYSEELQYLFGHDYRGMVDTLVKADIIDVDEKFHYNKLNRRLGHTKAYRFTDRWQGNGTSTIILKSDKARSIYLKRSYNRMIKAIDNEIYKHQLHFLHELVAPSTRAVKNKLMTMADNGVVYKGRHIIRYNELDYYTKAYKKLNIDITENYRDYFLIIEEVVDRYKTIWSNGFDPLYMAPPTEKCARITTPFSITPPFIRTMFRVNSVRLYCCDYKALHINIALNEYSHPTHTVTHSMVADYLGLNLMSVKASHLKFLNQRIKGMKDNPVYPYYRRNNPDFVKNIIKEKETNGHKSVSKRMFYIESKIAETVIETVTFPIYYVYDGFYCERKNINKLKIVMDNTAKLFNINTYGDIS